MISQKSLLQAQAIQSDFTNIELSDVIDVSALQKMMDDYYALTGIGIGIIDLKGGVLVGTGWQDICVKFHRAVPESCAYCHESDISLSRGVPPGTFKEYRCKNNMWDIVTPIMLGERHIGNIFLGQFLYDDEIPDYELFRAQARRFGYDEAKYLAALERVPRWSRETVQRAMGFYANLARMISEANYHNVILAEALAKQVEADEAIERLNTALAARAAELEATNRELEAFNYTVSHDLRAPLTNIAACNQIVMARYSASCDEEGRDLVRIIDEQATRMDQIITSLLEFSRLTHCRLRQEKVDLSSLAEVVTARLKSHDLQRRVEMIIAEGVEGEGDADLLMTVLENLIGNAWKYTGKVEEARIEFGVAEVDGTKAYFVRDNGHGFDMAFAAKLLLPFQRLPGADDCQGFGIGLATVDRIISRHGGRVWAEGAIGKGATFFFTL